MENHFIKIRLFIYLLQAFPNHADDYLLNLILNLNFTFCQSLVLAEICRYRCLVGYDERKKPL